MAGAGFLMAGGFETSALPVTRPPQTSDLYRGGSTSSSEAAVRLESSGILWDFPGIPRPTFQVKEATCAATYVKAGRSPTDELADQAGERRSLAELQGGNAMVLHLSRGGFDPKEHRFLRHLVDAYPDFRNAYTRLVLISTDNQLNINEFRDALGAHMAVPVGPGSNDPERTLTSKSSRMSHTIR